VRISHPWARALTLSLLKDLSNGVSGWISYQSREDEGTQSPAETLNRGWGSCRDFAVLFIEAARCLGFGARIVSGYRYNPTPNLMQSADAGSTHAWAEIYVSGGWVDHLRSNEPEHWPFQSDPRDRGARNVPVDAGRWKFRGRKRRLLGQSAEVSVISKSDRMMS
jgi:hypothetical protein